MPTPSFFQNYAQVVLGVEACLDKKLQLPALILIYTLIDSFAWTVYGDVEKSSRKRFEKWVENWMFSHADLKCTPADLYAARCGVLHTMTSESAMSQDGQARRITYAWGTASAEKLRSVIRALRDENLVALNIEDLFTAVREGMARVVEAMETDPRLEKRLEVAASKHFTNVENQKLDAFLANFPDA